MQEACDDKMSFPSLEASRCWIYNYQRRINTNIRPWPGSGGCGGKGDRQASVEGCEKLTILPYVSNGQSRCSMGEGAGMEAERLAALLLQ